MIVHVLNMFEVIVTLIVIFSYSQENVILTFVKRFMKKKMRVQFGLNGESDISETVSRTNEQLIEHAYLDKTLNKTRFVLEKI